VKKIAFNADKDGQAIRFLDPWTGDSRSGKLVYVLKPLPQISFEIIVIDFIYRSLVILRGPCIFC